MTDWHALHRSVRSRAPGRWLLAALSWLYGAGVWLRYGLYGARLLRRRKLPVRTVCFGNLTVGGTGKTSAVLLAAEELAARHARPVILSRGYRRPDRKAAVVALAKDSPHDWRAAGDEPWMLHQALEAKDVPVLVSPDRWRSGLLAARRYKAGVALMDDGFQHLALKRDADVVLLDAADPFGGGLLPYGLSREPRRALRRASLLVLTHVDTVPREKVAALRSELEALAPGVPVSEAVHRPTYVLDTRTGDKLPLQRLQGVELVSLSAIGDPAGFENLLVELGAKARQRWRFPNHHPYAPAELRSLEALRGGLPLVTTFKDLPRLPAGWKDLLAGDVWALGVRLKIVKGRKAWRDAVHGPEE